MGDLAPRFRAWWASPEARTLGTVPRWVAPLAVLALAGAAYWSSLWGEFLYDDLHTIRDNPGIRGLAAFWTHLPYQLHRPLLFLSFALNYEVGVLDPFGYHLVNLALHAFNAVLVLHLARVWLARGLGVDDQVVRERAAWLAAVLFALHPAQTESVSYVASRSSLLSTSFMLLAVAAFVRELHAGERARRAWRVFGLALFLAAMATKEVALVTPLLLLLVDRTLPWPGRVRDSWRASLRRVTPHLGLLAAGVAVRLMLQHAVRTSGVTWGVLDHWRTEAGAWLRYVHLTLLPVKLNVDPAIPLADSWGAVERLGLAVLATAILAAVLLRRKRPLASFAIGWFLISLAPTALIPLQDFIAERRLYLALVAPAVVAGFALARLGERLAWARGVSVATLALIAVMAVGTVVRNRAWSSSLALWSDTVRSSPDKARPHGNLATALGKAGNLDAAFAHYDRALALNPALDEYRIDRAALYRLLGRYDESLAELERVVASRPADSRLAVTAWHQIGEVQLARKDYDEALEVFLANTARNPVHPETFLRIGRIHFLRGDLAKAEEAFLESVHRWSWDPAGHRSLAFVYLRTGREPDAIRELEDALRADPDDQDASAALVEIRAGRPIRFD